MNTLFIERAFADTLMTYNERVLVLGGRDDSWPLAVKNLVGDTLPERLVVGLGPGSFAGIRAAIACLQGMSLGWDVPLFGLPSTAHLALCSGREEVTLIGDARRNTVWSVSYRVTPDAIVQTEALHLIKRTEFIPTAAMVSPDATRLAMYNLPEVKPEAALLEETLLRAEALLTSDPLPLYLHPAVSVHP